MQLRWPNLPKPMKFILWVIGSPLIAFVYLLAGYIFIIAMAIHFKRQYISPRVGWKSWFAWHPVRLLDPVWGKSNSFGRLVWLETVKRKYTYKHGDIVHCKPDEVEEVEAVWARDKKHREEERARHDRAFGKHNRPTGDAG